VDKFVVCISNLVGLLSSCCILLNNKIILVIKFDMGFKFQQISIGGLCKGKYPCSRWPRGNHHSSCFF